MSEFIMMLGILTRLARDFSVETRCIKAGDPTSNQTRLTVYDRSGVEDIVYIFNAMGQVISMTGAAAR